MDKYIVFGDSHSRCFSNVIETYSFSASSAKGLNNSNSLSNTNSKIRAIIEANKDKSIIFFFGKVDIDFILNHIYNKDIFVNLIEYLDNIVENYITFIKNLNIQSVYICEIPIPHLNDVTLLKVIQSPVEHHNLNKHLEEKYKPIRYNKVIPLTKRYNLTLYFNKQLHLHCVKNNYNLLEVNKYFKSGEAYKISADFLKLDKMDHHLDDSVHKLYIESLNNITQHQAH